jgi:hypothetical protein
VKHVSRLFPILAGAVVGSLGILALGCGGGDDNSSPTLDAGGVDSTTDGGRAEAAVSEDSTTSDVGATPDADAASAPDGDAASALDADAGASESSLTLSALSFPGQLAAALCTMTANCCGTSGDAAAFNWQSCYSTYLPFGFQGSSGGTDVLDGGHVAFNAAEAQKCLDTISAADCTTNQITSAAQIELYQSCFGAYAGTLGVGSPCGESIECAPGNLCGPGDGGSGTTCQALAGVGGDCSVLGATLKAGQTVCSYRGSASNGLFCQNISGDAGTAQLPLSQWQCHAQWPVGSECNGNQDCASYICHQLGPGSLQCASAGNWANASTCSSFVIADAGGGD